MSEVEKRIVRALLMAAKVDRKHLDWMVESCPSVARAREFYGRAPRVP